MILSKLTTANNLDAIAAAEMSASATMRSSDEVFLTVSGEMSDGSEYAFVAMATVYCTARYSFVEDGRDGGEMRMWKSLAASGTTRRALTPTWQRRPLYLGSLHRTVALYRFSAAL